ncbi:MAG TPA: response regulator transcription factor [Terriglobales bacterium]|nr:response regulator transcription factor [Terriglobales bacterium]
MLEKPPAAAESEGSTGGCAILLIEDDIYIQRSVGFQLGRQGYKVTCIADGEDGLEEALLHEYAVVVVDVMLPRLDGLNLCRRLRRARPEQPIIIVSARDSELDKIAGLEFGADDYLGKPFSVLELEARIRALMRRAGVNQDRGPAVIEVGGVALDRAQHELRVGGIAVRLTPKEMALLHILMSAPGRAFTRDYLLAQVWGTTNVGYHRAVDANVLRLRNKIGESIGAAPTWLEAIYGVGYRFRDPSIE